MPPSNAAVRRRPRRLATEVVDGLSERIRGGALKPGDKLPTESAIMQEFGVSRTVVREAIAALQASGLVETRHGIGTFVIARPAVAFDIPTVRDILAMLELRISLESEAARLAATRRTAEQLEALRLALNQYQAALREGGDTAEPDFHFHLRIAEATGNRYFPEVLARFGTTTIPRTRITWPQSAADQTAFLTLLAREHEQIFQAILRGDPAAASQSMRAHLTNSDDRFRRAEDALAHQPTGETLG